MLRFSAPGAWWHFRSIVLLLIPVFLVAGADAAVVRLATKKDLHKHGLLFPLTAPPVATPILLTDLGIQVFSLPLVIGEGGGFSIQFMGNLQYQIVPGSAAEGLLSDLTALAQSQPHTINSNAWWKIISGQTNLFQPASSMTWWWDLHPPGAAAQPVQHNTQLHLLPFIDFTTWWWNLQGFHPPVETMMPVTATPEGVDPVTGQTQQGGNADEMTVDLQPEQGEEGEENTTPVNATPEPVSAGSVPPDDQAPENETPENSSGSGDVSPPEPVPEAIVEEGSKDKKRRGGESGVKKNNPAGAGETCGLSASKSASESGARGKQGKKQKSEKSRASSGPAKPSFKKENKKEKGREQLQEENKEPPEQEEAQEEKKKTETSKSDNPGPSSPVTALALVHTVAVPKRVCGQRPDRGWAPDFRKHCDAFYRGMKKLADNLGKWLPGKGRKKVKAPVLSKRHRPRGSSQSSPIFTTGYTLLAISAGVAASLFGYWYLAADTDSDDSERLPLLPLLPLLPPEPEAEDTKLHDPVDCTKVRNTSLRKRCQKLSERKQHVTARLIRYFDLNRWRMWHFYVSAVYKVTVKGKLMLESLDAENKDTLLFGAVGYPARQSTGRTGSPVFQIISKTYFELILKAATKLAGLSSEILSTSLTGRFDPIAQALFWCGIPQGEPAEKLHQSCVDWLIRQFESLGPGWYEEGGHGLYYRMLTESYQLKPGKRYLGYLPRFYLKDIGTIAELWYEPRILAISREGRSLNLPTDNVPESDLVLSLEGMPETFDILVPTKINRWYAIRRKVQRQGAEFTSHNRRLGYAIRASGERYPERFFTFSGEELLESPLGRQYPVTGFGQGWQSPGAGYLNTAVYSLPWQLYLHEELHIDPRSGMTREEQEAQADEPASVELNEVSPSSEHAPVTPPGTDLQTDFSARTRGLEPLMEHYFNAFEYDKGNMVSALLKDRELPVGVIDFQPDQETLVGIRYRPLTSMPIEQQAKVFEKSYRECQMKRPNGRCDHSDINDVEVLRFHLAVCSSLKIPDCVLIVKDDLSRSFWESLVNMLDWPETEHSLFYPADRLPAGTYITFPRLLLQGRQWSFEISSQASSRSGNGIDTETIFLNKNYECVYQDIKGRYLRADGKCQSQDGWTTTFPYIDGRTHLHAPDGSVGHWLVFKDSHLLQPFWHREATWFRNHVWYKPPEIPASDSGSVAVEKEKTTAHKKHSADQRKPQGKKQADDFCADIGSNTLRDACIKLRPDGKLQAIITALGMAAEKNQWLPVFSYQQYKFGKDRYEHYYSLNRKTHFNDLPAARVMLHLAMLQRYETLNMDKNDQAGWLVLSYSGLVENLLPGADEQIVYEQMYKIISDDRSARESQMQSGWHLCYQQHLKAEDWCPRGQACLHLVPQWKVVAGKGYLADEPLLFEQNAPVFDLEPEQSSDPVIDFSAPDPGAYKIFHKVQKWLSLQKQFRVTRQQAELSINIPEVNRVYALFLNNAVQPYTLYMLRGGELLRNPCDLGPELRLSSD